MMKEDKEEGIPGEQGACCLSQQLYIDSGNNKNLLYLLSINRTNNQILEQNLNF